MVLGAGDKDTVAVRLQGVPAPSWRETNGKKKKKNPTQLENATTIKTKTHHGKVMFLIKQAQDSVAAQSRNGNAARKTRKVSPKRIKV